MDEHRLKREYTGLEIAVIGMSCRFPDANNIEEFWENLPKISEDELFIKAGIDSSIHHWVDKGIGLIDSAILIVSRESNSFVWSLDKKLNKILHKEERYKSR